MGDGYRFAATTGEVAIGRSRRCVIDGQSVLVCNVGGEYYAVADVCTHDRGPLGEGRLRGPIIECPRHGARFDVRDGSVKVPPAVVPIDTYPVRVRGDELEVELSEP
ncbi:MAG TPA: non-heme iron oxygenase ferredoxin subunit [Acidimicrobiia bacterium]|nr:non-heme iron oxygenase ferredoxin subunit [Acidimicrobiia bacterium]